MNLGIALLLRGSPADLSATLHTIELAKRTTGAVHAVFMEPGGAGPGEGGEGDSRTLAGQFIALASWLGDAAGVAIHFHRLESRTDALLLRFLCEYRIFCLVLGADGPRSLKRESAWVARLRHRLAEKEGCFLPHLWSVIIPPWDDHAITRIMAGFSRPAWGTNPIEILAGSLRNDLKGFDNTTGPDDNKVLKKKSARRKKCTCTFR